VVPEERREKLLGEFERSALSGVKFAKLTASACGYTLARMKSLCAILLALSMSLAPASARIRKDELAEKEGKVRSLLIDAAGFASTGRYDLARKRCNQALGIDRNNLLARELLERIERARAEDKLRPKIVLPTGWTGAHRGGW